MAKTAAAVRRENALVKAAAGMGDMASGAAEWLSANPTAAGALAGGLGGGAIGALTSRKDEDGRNHRGHNAISGAMAGAGLGGGLGLAYSTGKHLLPKLNLSPGSGGLPENIRSRMPEIADQISELQQQSPWTTPFTTAGNLVGGYMKNHPILSAIGIGDIASNALSGAAGIARRNNPMATLNVDDLLRGAGNKLTELKDIAGKGSAGEVSKVQKLVQMGVGSRDKLQDMLVAARGGGKIKGVAGVTPQMLANLTESGRGGMGSVAEGTDVLNAVNRFFRGREAQNLIEPLTATGFDAAGRKGGPHNALLRLLSSSDVFSPSRNMLLPRLGLYGGVPLAMMAAKAISDDRANQQKIQRLVASLGGQNA